MTVMPAMMHAHPVVKLSANFAGKTMSTGSAMKNAITRKNAPAPKSMVAYAMLLPSGSASRAACTAPAGSDTAALACDPIRPRVELTPSAALDSELDRKGRPSLSIAASPPLMPPASTSPPPAS